MFSLEDIQSFCDDLSAWIIELDLKDELKNAGGNLDFPLTADKDDLKDGWDTLVYLTCWMCLKSQKQAPPHIESRILLTGNLETPWKLLYSRFCNALENKRIPPVAEGTMLEMIDIWNLAG